MNFMRLNSANCASKIRDILLLFTVVLLFSSSAEAQADNFFGIESSNESEKKSAEKALSAGELDQTFGTNGVAVTDFNNEADAAQDLAIQRDGKIVVAGFANIDAAQDRALAIARYNANGTLDTSFDADGKVLINPTVGDDRAYGVAIQTDGKIVVSGNTNFRRNRIIVRLNADGSLDTSFGTNGSVTVPINGMSGAINLSPGFDETKVAIQTDGKIVTSGSARTGAEASDRFCVIRVNADGTLDTTFGGTGKVLTLIGTLGQTNDRAFNMLIQPDGKIVLSGYTIQGSAALAAVRYNTDGSLDTTFDADGKAVIAYSTPTFGYSIARQPDGKLILVGRISGSAPDVLTTRINTDGSLDTTFGASGFVRTDINNRTDGATDVIYANNRIVVVGYSAPDLGLDAFLTLVFNLDGTPDTTFGTNGYVLTDLAPQSDTPYAIAVQPDGKLVLAGIISPAAPAPSDFAVLRYNFVGGNVPRETFADFNGDGKTDWSVIREGANGAAQTWFIRYNGAENLIATPFGVRSTDVPQPVDFDGDGKDDIAVWRGLDLNMQRGFYILNSQTNTVRFVLLGNRNDIPVSADYDGDGKADPAVFTTVGQIPNAAYWCYVRSLNNPNNQQTCVQWGARYNSGVNDVDRPYPGDFDGDGKADFAIQRPIISSVPDSSANSPAFFAIRTSGGTEAYDYWGRTSDRLVPGDYNGDGKTDLCVARGFATAATQIFWFIRYRNSQPDEYVQFGQGANANFVQGDYDGDGKTDIALWQNGIFIYRASANNNRDMYYQWGAPTDLPASAYNNR